MPAMDDLQRELEAVAKSERRVAMATVVATRGTTPKKDGARMWIGEGGRAIGTTIGGCVDAELIPEAHRALTTGERRIVSIGIDDDEAWEMGLSCGGAMDVLVEPLEIAPRPAPLLELYRRIAARMARGQAACVVRPLRDPSRVLVVGHDGGAEGTLGDAAQDEAARKVAMELLPAGLPRTHPIAGEGTEAFFEVHAPRPHLVAVGAGHMSMPLVTLARALGFRTTVVDARPRFATRERFADADDVRVGTASDVVSDLVLGPATAVVLTVHDQDVEVPVLRAVLASDTGYVGMLGSRKRGQRVLQILREQGVPPEQLARVQVPVGLDIGAQTAAEIALSVVAQIVASRRGRAGRGLAESAP